jgi:hypothetical protein
VRLAMADAALALVTIAFFAAAVAFARALDRL